MENDRSGLVGIVRDFLFVHREMRELFERFRQGDLDFDDVQALVDDRDTSVLFRLKERCHALFRSGEAPAGSVGMSEALFDLAVGSLFHEAMKFRENFYQLKVYGPRVRRLRSEAGDEAGELFSEFQKILEGGVGRLREAQQESETLLDQTRNQLRVLLLHYGEDGLLARCLIEHAVLVDEVFPREGIRGLLAEMHGEASEGYLAAARSYLASAHFDHALDALAEARKRSGGREDLDRLMHYAAGMQAFLAGNYPSSLRRLKRWAETGVRPDEVTFGRLARDAVAHVSTRQAETADPDDDLAQLSAAARPLLEQLKAQLAEIEGSA